jgi:glycosyltransferase involved in cell wall biosynthesis
MDDILLTITIPTYNRPKQLLSTLNAILPQLTSECQILILDNNSAAPIDFVFEKITDKSNLKRIEIVRNKNNIGACANVARCIELCSTPYIWILSDDDFPLPDAIETIIRNIKEQPEIVFFNYYCELFQRNKSTITVGLVDFINNIDDFSNLLFLSNNIYRMDFIKENIQFAYQYSFTLAPQIAILLQSLDINSPTKFVAEKIVSWGKSETEGHWSVVQQSLGYNSLIELPNITSNGLAQCLAYKLNTGKVSLPIIFREVLFLTKNKNYNYNTSKYILDQIFFRRFYFYPFYLNLLRLPFIFLLRFPKTLMIIFRLANVIRNKPKYDHHYDNFYK